MRGKGRIAKMNTGESLMNYKDPAHATETIDD